MWNVYVKVKYTCAYIRKIIKKIILIIKIN